MEDPDTVRDFAREFNATHDRLDVLIHNAGAIHPQFRTDEAGTELTVLGQVTAPFLLTRLLMPTLLAAAPSRVITVSSGGGRRAPGLLPGQQPILLTPEQGADTIVWQALSPSTSGSVV